jgi:hypothetical protein
VKKGSLMIGELIKQTKKEPLGAFSSKTKSTIQFRKLKFSFLRVNIAPNPVLKRTLKKNSSK